MRSTAIGVALVIIALILATLSIAEPGVGSIPRNSLGITAAVTGVIGALILIRLVFSGSEYADRYVMLNGSLICKSESLSRHKCVLNGFETSELKTIMNRVLNELVANHNYRLRDSSELMAVLSGGSVKGKSVMMVMHVDKESSRLEITYVIDPLRASGLADLKWIAKEVNEVLSRVMERV